MIDSSLLKKIKKQAITHAIFGIKKVISGKQEKYSTNILCCSDILSLLQDLGSELIGDMDTNGWQWDFWQTIKVGEKYFKISGSGYYGNILFRNEKEYERHERQERENYGST